MTTLIKNIWPPQSDAYNFFGNPAQSNWLHNNTIDVKCPWTLHMDKLSLQNILIHKKLADSLTRILNYIWEQSEQSQAKIEELHYDRYSGSYNYRPIRGGSGLVLSQHSYAAAIDFDAEENQQHSQKHLFLENSLIVQAFKGEGWTWGGDWSPRSIDAMHFQALKV